jgi:hypothetical protein
MSGWHSAMRISCQDRRNRSLSTAGAVQPLRGSEVTTSGQLILDPLWRVIGSSLRHRPVQIERIARQTTWTSHSPRRSHTGPLRPPDNAPSSTQTDDRSRH